MERATKAIDTAIVLLLGAGTVLGGVGASLIGHSDAQPFFAACIGCFGFAVVLFGYHFGIHPAIVRLDEWRVSFLSKHRAGRSEARRSEPEVERPSPKLEIVSAVYGAANIWRDVTLHVRSQVGNDGVLTMAVTNDNLGGDPIYGFAKSLVIEYDAGFGPRRITHSEGDNVVVPPPGG